jgi:hypothetical protein
MSEQHHDDKHRVGIEVNGKTYEVGDDELSGRTIKELAGISIGNLLFRESKGDGDDEQIADDTVVELRGDDSFYDMPPGNFG